MIKVEWEKLPHFGDAMKAKKKEAWQEGREEGLQKGGVLALQDMLIELLNIQFGHVPGKTIHAVQAIQSPRLLKALVRKSLKAASLSEVQKLLVASRTKTNGRHHSANAR